MILIGLQMNPGQLSLKQENGYPETENYRTGDTVNPNTPGCIEALPK